jgi:hypothetical protein
MKCVFRAWNSGILGIVFVWNYTWNSGNSAFALTSWNSGNSVSLHVSRLEFCLLGILVSEAEVDATPSST